MCEQGKYDKSQPPTPNIYEGIVYNITYKLSWVNITPLLLPVVPDV